MATARGGGGGWCCGGGGALHPVTHNLAHVCPPRERLHVSSAANQETDVRRAERGVDFPRWFYSNAFHPPPSTTTTKIQTDLSVELRALAEGKKSFIRRRSASPLLSPLPPPSPLNPSASCRSVSLPVSVPIRFHLIHVTSINTQSSPDKSRPLSPPLCLSCVAVHHSLFPQQASFVVTPNVGKRLPAQVSRSTFNTSLLFPRLCFWRALVSAPPPLKMKVS